MSDANRALPVITAPRPGFRCDVYVYIYRHYSNIVDSGVYACRGLIILSGIKRMRSCISAGVYVCVSNARCMELDFDGYCADKGVISRSVIDLLCMHR